MSYLNKEVLDDFPYDAFLKKDPFPWHQFESLIDPNGFSKLIETFPDLKFFRYHRDFKRVYGQRPHNRFYLTYFDPEELRSQRLSEGIIKHDQLHPVWQSFISELLNALPYRQFINKAFDTTEYFIKLVWHLGVTGNEVSPHLDSATKLGTHIFYFNTHDDWDLSWGGDLLILEDKLIEGNAPDFDDFKKSISISNIDNKSFFFKNGPKSWHGVKPLKCPENAYRRLFNVVFQCKSEPPAF